ncbi:MAG: hypothetical protein H6601_08505 [Flavobacteriales bacterium]|nr:hypothetical protein [Flavobacteriales bacterium]
MTIFGYPFMTTVRHLLKMYHFLTCLGLSTFLALAVSGQPLPDGEETLAIEAQNLAITVPDKEAFEGGHLQGVQLFNGTLIVSGSSQEFGYLAIFQFIGGEFRFIATKKLAAAPFDHAGGFQVAENWLAVGVEDPTGKRSSIVQLIDVSSFGNLSKPPVYSLKRQGEYKRSTAGAVALLKRDGHFLLAVGSWDSAIIDFYTSNHTDPYAEDFKFEAWTSWDSREAKRKDWVNRDYNSYQSLQLTEDSTGVYLTGFAKRGNSNLADVFKLRTDADPYTLIQKVSTYSVQCKGDVTFRNGAGLSTFLDQPSIVAVGHKLTPTTNIQIFPVKR